MVKKSERILVLGLGSMGSYLTHQLSHQGHLVTVIESSRQLIEAEEEHLDARLIVGDAMDFQIWKEANAAEMDYMIAATNDDAVNMMASLIASKLGIKQIISRIRGVPIWEANAIIRPFDLHVDLVIRPEELAAQEIVRLIKVQSGNVLVDLGDGSVTVLSTVIHRNSPLIKKSMRELAEAYGDLPFRVVCVARDIDTFIPGGDFRLQAHDRVFIIANSNNLPRLRRIVELTDEEHHNVLIVGGGMVGARVAELLQDSLSVRIIEKSEARAEELSHILRKTECLHGDGSDRETLLQAGLLHMDTVVATTDVNESNIMTCVLAKHLVQTRAEESLAESVRTIALIRREAYLVLASAMGIDVALSKEVLAANHILRYLRRGHVLSVAHLHGCDAEVVELLADPGSRITRAPLRDIRELVDRVIVGAIGRDGLWEIAVGATHVKAGDKVICISNSEDLGHLQALFLA